MVADRLWHKLRRDRAGRDDADESRLGDDEPVSIFEGREDVLRTLRDDPPPPPAAESPDDAGPVGREAAYAEWAERMRAKREDRKRRIREVSAEPEDDEPPSGPSEYWTTDYLFAESRRLEDEHGRAIVTRTDLLRVLELPSDADDATVHRQYRRLAKQHHPDRFPDADEVTKQAHAEEMHRIATAYQALQNGA